MTEFRRVLFRSPTYNYNAPEQAVVKAEQNARDKYNRSLQNFANQSSYFDIASAGFEINQMMLRPYMSYVGEFSDYASLSKNIGNAGRMAGTLGNIAAGASLVVDYNTMQQGDMSAYRFGYHATSFGTSVAIGASVGGVYGAAAGGVFWSGEVIYDHFVVPFLDFYWQLEQGLRTFPQWIGFPY